MLQRMRILFAWELGAGMGHLAPHRKLLEALKARGHEVTVVSRDVARADKAFSGLSFPVHQAPLFLGKPDPAHNPTATMAQVLHNAGLYDSAALLSRTRAWDRLLQWIRPELVLMDYAPTLQLALRGSALPAAVFATGYFVPPPVVPVPVYWSMRGRLPPHVKTGEEETLAVFNRVLEARDQAPLLGLSHLWHDDFLPILKTYPDLDHYPERQGGLYVGSPPSPRGQPPRWPESAGKRIFAYLKPSPIVGDLLEALKATSEPVLIASDGLSQSVRDLFSSNRMVFETSPIDLYETFETAHLAVTNANHGTTSHALSAGVPVLAVPLHLEQSLIAARTEALGAGLTVNSKRPGDIQGQLGRLLDESSFAKAARDFAERNRGLSMEKHLSLVFQALDKIAPVGGFSE